MSNAPVGQTSWWHGTTIKWSEDSWHHWSKLGSTATLHTPIGSKPSRQPSPNLVENLTVRWKGCGAIFWNAHGILFIEYLESDKSLATVTWLNCCIWWRKSRENGPIWRRIKFSFTKTMHRATGRWQKYTNAHREDYDQLKRWSPKLRPTSRPKKNRSARKVYKC